METILKTNIERAMQERGLKKLTELERLCGVPYRTLQDIMYEKVTARITTVAAIAAGLGISPGKLLESPDGMEFKPKPASKEVLLIAIFENAMKLEEPDLRRILNQIKLRIQGLDEDDDLLKDSDNVDGAG